MKKKFNHGINNLQHIGMDNGNILIGILVLFLTIFSYKVKIKICDIRFINLKNGLIKIPSISVSDLKWSKEQLEIKSQILKGNYIDTYGSHIKVTKDNICFNGHHRLSVLKQVKPPNYEIVVHKLLLVNFNIVKLVIKYLNPEINKYLKKRNES